MLLRRLPDTIEVALAVIYAVFERLEAHLTVIESVPDRSTAVALQAKSFTIQFYALSLSIESTDLHFKSVIIYFKSIRMKYTINSI
jgi:hypothetical protein